MILLYVVIGLSVGSVSGALGIGGGVLLVPALIWLCRFDPPKAAGTSLAVLIPPIGLPAAMKAYEESRVDLTAAICIAAAFTIGAYFGAAIVNRIPPLTLRLMFGSLMIYVGLRYTLGATSQAGYAAAALGAVILAWIGHLGLRALGRRHLPAPRLGEQIRRMKEKGVGDIDYHI
jgi:uncharacterized membrane protein YfcA